MVNDEEQSEAFVTIKSIFNQILKDKFHLFEKYGSKDKKAGRCYFNNGYCQSTYDPQVIKFNELFEIVPNLREFGNIPHREITIDYPYYKDMNNKDITVVPLAALVTPDDTHQIFLHSRLQLPECDQVKDVTKYVYELCFINNIWEISSLPIRKTILQFFSNIFTTEVNHIDTLLKTDQTFILMIINRLIKTSPVIEVEHIIAAVIYGADQCESICIDYISTGVGYYSYGYGTLILHMAQVFASEYNLNHQK